VEHAGAGGRGQLGRAELDRLRALGLRPDVIISGGENISSVEVEGALLRQAAVQEVAAVGMPDEAEA